MSENIQTLNHRLNKIEKTLETILKSNNKFSNSRGTVRNKQCYTCKRFGHISKQCWHNEYNRFQANANNNRRYRTHNNSNNTYPVRNMAFTPQSLNNYPANPVNF